MEEKTIREVNILKGRLAEEVVRLLFEYSGYIVYRSGMEHALPLYTKKTPNEFDELEMWIRRIPDFLVVKDGRSLFIEVKYVTKFYNDFYTRFEHYPDYPQVFIVVVTPQEIDCRTLKDIKDGIRFDNVYKKFLEEIEDRRAEMSEADSDKEIDEEEIKNIFPRYKESLNRLGLLGMDREQRQRFHSYFLSTAKEILIASKVQEPSLNAEIEENETSFDKIKEVVLKLPLILDISRLSKRVIEQRQIYPRAFEPWSLQEDDLLRQAYTQNQNLNELSKVFQRNNNDLNIRLKKLQIKME